MLKTIIGRFIFQGEKQSFSYIKVAVNIPSVDD
jgi:hypothetical protein